MKIFRLFNNLLPQPIFNQKGSVQIFVVALLVAGAALGGYLIQQKTTLKPQAAQKETSTQTSNGAPSGSHYNLNIIGVPKGKTASMTGGSGHRIFVPLEGTCKINLSIGDFQVLDANCTDGPAIFQLPNPDPTNSGTTLYSVYARALGKPGGRSTTTPCATDVATGETYCSVYSMVAVRDSGKQSFTNVSKLLLYAYVDLNGDGTVERYPLFDQALQDYFWQYDNQGLKLLQLRFYPVSTNVN
jgi:hypothetical protein